jgi:hypothetical protein
MRPVRARPDAEAVDILAIVLLVAVFGSLWGLTELLDRV